MESLCKSCLNVREVVSGTGSKFLLCRFSKTDKRFPKHPPQPVVRCDGYQEKRSGMTTYSLEVLLGAFAVCRLDPGEPTPEWARGPFVSVTRTPEELSVVCPEDAVPVGIECQPGWRCLRVAGKLPFSMVGVIHGLTAPLAAAGIGVFVLSSFDTDYLLVGAGDLDRALVELRAAGYSVEG